jgi:hypothetical protein
LQPEVRKERVMNQKYDAIFSRLYSGMPTLSQPRLNDIKLAVDNATVNTNKTLRSDAKYFLFINFAHMVETPLAENNETSLYPFNNMNEDIKTLVQSASLQDPDETEISGHQIIQALSQTWPSLKLSSLRIWGSD